MGILSGLFKSRDKPTNRTNVQSKTISSNGFRNMDGC